MMFDLYKSKLQSQGNYIGEVRKQQSSMIMNQTFEQDVACKKCIIDGKIVFAKFIHPSNYSISNNIASCRLQFKTGVHYKIGTYVQIPDDIGELYTWLIIDRDNDPQFVKYHIVKCNKHLKWIYKDTIYTCNGALLDGNNMSINSGFIDQPESEVSFWIPYNSETETITYDTRFLINNSLINPLVYKTIGFKYSFPEGIVKVKLSQDQYNPNSDNLESMIADYYKSQIEPTLPPDKQVEVGTSKITHNGTTPSLKIGGSYKTLTATFYDASGNVLHNITPKWSYTFQENISESFDIVYSDTNQIQIKALNDSKLVGKVLTVSISDASGNYLSSIKLEVVAR